MRCGSLGGSSRIEQAGLRAGWWIEAEVGVSAAVQTAPSCRASNEAKLNEVRLDHVLDCVARLAEPGGQRLHPDWAAAVKVGDHRQVSPVHRVEAERVDL